MEAETAERRGADGWTNEAREELQRLRRKNLRLKRDDAFSRKTAA